MIKNRSYHPQSLVIHSILRCELIGSEVIHIIHNFKLFIASKAFSSQPGFVHVNQSPERLIASIGSSSQDYESFKSFTTLGCS